MAISLTEGLEKMVSVVPSLSTQGWLTTIEEKADRLLGYFFSSEYSQTVCYYGRISSLPYLIAIHQSRMTELKSAIDKALNRLMASFFEKILINVNIKPDDDSQTKYTIYVSAKIIEGDDSYELAHVINIKDSVIFKISKLSGN